MLLRDCELHRRHSLAVKGRDIPRDPAKGIDSVRGDPLLFENSQLV